MADSPSQIDAAAEKAFADTAVKKTTEAAEPLKPVAGSDDTAEPKAAMPVAADKAVADKPAAKKPVGRKSTTSKPALAKALATKAPNKKKAAGKVSAKTPAKARVASQTAKPDTTISQLKDKIMATNPTDFTAKMKESAAEMQSRMQTAYDKSTEMTKEVTDFHKGNLEAMVESSKLFAAGMQDMGQSAIEGAKADAETMTDDVKKMAAVKSPTELFQLQGEIARRNVDTIVARASKGAEAWMKLANEAFAPLTSRASIAMDKMKTAA